MNYACIHMKRTMILVPDEMDARLRFEAARRGVSVAEVTREALAAYLGPPAEPRPLSFFGVGDGAPDDVSERVDEFVSAAVKRRHRAPR